jgi:hypothetical protein
MGSESCWQKTKGTEHYFCGAAPSGPDRRIETLPALQTALEKQRSNPAIRSAYNAPDPEIWTPR